MATSLALDKIVSATPLARARAVSEGVPAAAVRDLVADRIVTLTDLARAVGPRRTLDRRLKENAPLSPKESDRLVQFMTILDLASRIFGSRAKAMAWLDSPMPRFDDQKPLDMIRSDAGARLVEDTLQQARHGFAA